MVLVYDITCRESFNNIGRWLEEIRTYSNEKITTLLVGNKIDLDYKYHTSYIVESSLMKKAIIWQRRMI